MIVYLKKLEEPKWSVNLTRLLAQGQYTNFSCVSVHHPHKERIQKFLKYMIYNSIKNNNT